jgi:Uma2 family endonuclease
VEAIIVAGSHRIDIPAWVVDFESFRRWLHSGEFPEEGKICFINDKVWVDPSMEEYDSHNQVRTEIGRVLANLMKETKLGRYLTEGMRYSHPETQLSTEPDGMVISNKSLNAGRVKFVGGRDGDNTEVVGSPDILIDVVSKSSEVKDTEWAMSAYFDSGNLEYWVIDAREEDDIKFDIFKRGKNGFTATRKQAGWLKSAVPGKSFKLVQTEDDTGKPEFTLDVR